MTNTNDLNKALDQANEQIDRMIGIETMSDYVASLDKQHTNQYMIRPDGTIEFFKA